MNVRTDFDELAVLRRDCDVATAIVDVLKAADWQICLARGTGYYAGGTSGGYSFRAVGTTEAVTQAKTQGPIIGETVRRVAQGLRHETATAEKFAAVPALALDELRPTFGAQTIELLAAADAVRDDIEHCPYEINELINRLAYAMEAAAGAIFWKLAMLVNGSLPEAHREGAIIERGYLEPFCETGTEGIIWSTHIDGGRSYDGMHCLNEGDALHIYDNDGRLRWHGIIDFVFTSWNHGCQRGMTEDEWAQPFFDTAHAIVSYVPQVLAHGPDLS